jgi:hypothetical protein
MVQVLSRAVAVAVAVAAAAAAVSVEQQGLVLRKIAKVVRW